MPQNWSYRRFIHVGAENETQVQQSVLLAPELSLQPRLTLYKNTYLQKVYFKSANIYLELVFMFCFYY